MDEPFLRGKMEQSGEEFCQGVMLAAQDAHFYKDRSLSHKRAMRDTLSPSHSSFVR